MPSPPSPSNEWREHTLKLLVWLYSFNVQFHHPVVSPLTARRRSFLAQELHNRRDSVCKDHDTEFSTARAIRRHLPLFHFPCKMANFRHTRKKCATRYYRELDECQRRKLRRRIHLRAYHCRIPLLTKKGTSCSWTRQELDHSATMKVWTTSLSWICCYLVSSSSKTLDRESLKAWIHADRQTPKNRWCMLGSINLRSAMKTVKVGI